MRIAIFRFFLIVVAFSTISASAHSESLSFPAFGLSIESPADWIIQSAEVYSDNLDRVDFGNPEFKQLVLKYSSAPLLSVTRFPEPHPELNPSINIKTRDGQVDDPVELLQLVKVTLKGVYPDLEVTDGPRSTTVGGRNAAFMQVEYTLTIQDGLTFPVASRMWIVPRDRHFLIIGSGTKQREDAAVLGMIDASIASIRFEN